MKYVDSNLMSGEQVVYRAKIHWWVFVPGLVALVIAVVLMNSGASGDYKEFFGIVFLLIAVVALVKAVIAKTSTELAVTTKRVIAKTGLIGRNTIELNHGKVESFNIIQSIAGRVFGFGTVVVHGTGGGRTPIPNIDSPLEFRRKAVETIDASQMKTA